MGGDIVTEVSSGTSAGLQEFLAWAGDKGELNPTTANALKSAVGRVLQLEDDPAKVDIRALDVGRALDRFETQYRTSYTSGSMSTYKTRFRQAVSMYLAWLDKDPGWKTVVKSRSKATSTMRKPAPSGVLQAAEPALASDAQPDNVSGHPDRTVRQVKYQLPLRPDLIVQIELPVDLTHADAERVASFVKSLAFDQPRRSGEAEDRQPERGNTG